MLVVADFDHVRRLKNRFWADSTKVAWCKWRYSELLLGMTEILDVFLVTVEQKRAGS